MKDLSGWTIAFDLDGTLVETAPDLIGTLNRLLAARGLPPRPVSVLFIFDIAATTAFTS